MQSDLLDTVIGVVFVWFLLSSVLATIGEGLALVTRARAKHLWLAVGRLVEPTKATLSAKLLDSAINLPILGKADVRPRATPPSAGDRSPAEPSVSPTAGSLAWWSRRPDRTVTGALKEVRGPVQEVYDALAPQVVEIARPGRLSKVNRLAAESFAEAIVGVARKVHPADLIASTDADRWSQDELDALVVATARLSPSQALTIETVAGLSSEIPPDKLRELYHAAASRFTGRDVADYLQNNRQLASIVRSAAAAAIPSERVAGVKKAIESSFDREMDQVSTFYRRQNRKILGLLAIPLVLVCHANSIEIFNQLRGDADLRQAALNAAVATVSDESVKAALDARCGPVTTTTTPAVAGSAADTTTTTTTASTTTTSTTTPLQAAAERFSCAAKIIDGASRFRVGLAWQEIKEAHGVKGAKAKPEVADVAPYLWGTLHDGWGVVGRAITLLALLFGAQFWFDALGRLVGLRGTPSGGPRSQS